MNKLITEHFTWEEMQRSDTAARLGLDNDIPVEFQPNAHRVAEALEDIRAYYQGKIIRVTSCYRSKELNKAIGGSKTSAHCSASAADFIVENVSNIEVCKVIPDIIKDYDQIIYEFGPKGWVHLGFATKPRFQKLSAIKQDGKTLYIPGIVA
jgi:zinc D-Ala-D-Ala carboxypeptidase